jgi:hypothetical protein
MLQGWLRWLPARTADQSLVAAGVCQAASFFVVPVADGISGVRDLGLPIGMLHKQRLSVGGLGDKQESPARGGDQDAGFSLQFAAGDGGLAAVMHHLARGQQRLAEPRGTHEVDVELRRDGVLIRATQRRDGTSSALSRLSFRVATFARTWATGA